MLGANSTIDLYISLNNKPKIEVYTSNGSPFINIYVNINAKILSFNDSTNKLSLDLINKIEDSAKQYLTNELYNYLYKTSKDYNSDITGIGKFAAKNFSTLQEWQSYNWLANYSSSSFKVNVDFSIKSGYLLTNE